jgi:glyoxylase-like metal-dependent hydrolase (beta-lactamase superfamily II)
MSPAFVKEIDKIAPLGERPVSQHPNYVTPEGRAHIAGEVRRLSQDLAKAQPHVDRDAVASAGSDLRYWLQRLASAQTIAGLDDHAEVRSHRHFDHADGNAWLNSVGARIIAQANTRKHLSEVQRLEDRNYNFLPLPTGGIPSEVFSNEHGLKLNGSSIGLKYYDPAHTDSDISVTFGEADILRAADTYWNGIYPFIDYSTGGSIDGMIAASEASFAATTDKTIIIPGHGKPVSNRGELKDFRDSWSQSGRTLPRSKSREDRETRRSQQSRPLPLTLSGATSATAMT